MANFNKKALIYGGDNGHQQRQKSEFERVAGSEGWSATIDDFQSNGATDLVDRALNEGFDFVFYAFTSQNFNEKEWNYAFQNGVLPVLPHCDNSNALCTDFRNVTSWMAIGGDHPNLSRRSFGPHLELEAHAGTSSESNLTTAESHTTAITAGVLAFILENGFDHSGMSKKEALLEARARLRTKGDNYSNWVGPDNDGFGYYDYQDVTSNWTTINDVEIQPPLGVFVKNIDSKHISINWTNYDMSKLSKTKIRDVKRDEIVYDGTEEYPRVDGSLASASDAQAADEEPGLEVRNYYDSNTFEMWHEDNNSNKSKKILITDDRNGDGLNFQPNVQIDFEEENRISSASLGEFDQVDWKVYKDGSVVESFSGSFLQNENLRFDSNQTSTYNFEVTATNNNIGQTITSDIEYTTFSLFSSRQYV